MKIAEYVGIGGFVHLSSSSRFLAFCGMHSLSVSIGPCERHKLYGSDGFNFSTSIPIDQLERLKKDYGFSDLSIHGLEEVNSDAA